MYGTGYYATGYYATAYYVGHAVIDYGVTLFTYHTLINESRQILKDRDPTNYRYSNDLLVSILNRGLHDLNRVRPDAWYVQAGVVPEVTANDTPDVDQIDWDTDFHPDLRFYPAMVDYVVGFTHMMEDAYVDEGVAQAFLIEFRKKASTT